ncbi:MAG: ATP-dependent helicase HrpB [Marinobacter sp.]|uniref:ATP-dependent helicase HrpB n=1 Tax=Marinobacter sp. TaxID=50741 RepID=UPI00299CF509|nr:ATP-dependent helicase HrpB [Marinobacter sp.]MDX1634159.1 ATP-dependent helicase HrpB [Marinobacter sp.]
MAEPVLQGLPIDALLPALSQTLRSQSTALLQAPPGAGKTTRVPPALLAEPWLAGRKLLMLEPRRLAARSAARFMARAMAEEPGQTVGYRTRLDSRISAATRIEVVTEGILTRLIQQDPALEAYGAVFFDEFHERSLQADLGLALVRESQQALRPDLRLLVMSATLDTSPLARILGEVPVLTSEGRAYPVTVNYRPPGRQERLEDQLVRVITEALAAQAGSMLVFLPGVSEIRRLERALQGRLASDVRVSPLYGNLGPEAQDRAIAPAAAGERKLVLATAIAETSLTIEGVTVVIDSGLARRARFDANSGMSRLVTSPVSKAGAEQRKGRAGRTGPGICYRLWSDSEQAALADYDEPEIRNADLAPVALELARWGARNPDDLDWIDPPPPGHWRQAVSSLQWLDLLDGDGAITDHGRAAAELGCHPRLAHMVLRGGAMGWPVLAAELAALLEERDLLGPGAGADLVARVEHLRRARGRAETDPRLHQLRQAARRLHPAGARDVAGNPGEAVGRLVALAYPDRIGRRRPGGEARYQLSNGRGAALRNDDPLAREEWIVAADLDGQAREARIYLAAALDPATLKEDLAGHIRLEDTADWDDSRGRVVAKRQQRLGALVLAETPLPEPPAEQVEAALLAVVRGHGLSCLPWTDAARQWCARVELLRRYQPEDWPTVSDAELLATLEQWLAPYLAGLTRWAQVQRLDLTAALSSLLDYPRQQRLEQLAPSHLTIATGQRVTLDYTADTGPVAAAKLQAFFGWTATPRIIRGEHPVVLHLLSPAGRPLAVTSDLASFWRNAYPEVRKDMRGRYPKHPWPEDPVSAEARAGTKKQGY